MIRKVFLLLSMINDTENSVDGMYETVDCASVGFILGKAQRIAESFLYLYREQQKAPEENSYMVISEMILGGLALELFMKGLLKVSNPSVKFKSYSHKLAKLYWDLSDSIKESIYKEAKIIYNENGLELHDITHVESLMIMHNDAFVVFRYLFDEEKYNKAIHMGSFFIYVMIVCFYNYVAQNRDALMSEG